MDGKKRFYIAIDCKSFYASVECLERGLDPMTTNLVVADESRTDKTICLAVSPSLKAHGIPGRPRLFEVVRRVQEINRERLRHAPNHVFKGKSCDRNALAESPELELDYIIAVPRMAHYIACNTDIYKVYLKYVEPKDIHIYSIDEVFIDVTDYLDFYRQTPRELAGTIVLDVLKTTGITTTVGIGTNLYLCKVAMDIVAKHAEPDENGTRIAEFDAHLKLLYGKYQLAVGNLTRLLGIVVVNPVNCMKGVMDKLGIPRKYEAEAVDLFVAQYGETPCTAHEIYFGISEILYMLACEGEEGSRITRMEETIARALSVNWREYDVPGAYRW